MGDRRGELDERFLLLLLALMVTAVVVRWVSHVFGR